MEVRCGPKIDYELCNGCRSCYEVCPSDAFDWDDQEGLPIIAYADECYYCGACDLECPEEAINLVWPLHIMVDFGIYPNTQPTG